MALTRIPRAGWVIAGAALMFGVTGAITYASAATNVTTDQGSVFHPVSPVRIMNTRAGTVNIGTSPTPFAKAETRRLQVAGANGIPVDATAVVINFTVTDTTEYSFLTVWPSDEVRPDASNINWAGAGVTIANLSTVKLGADGALNVYNAFGTANVIADVAGYYTGADFVPLTTTTSTTSTTTPDDSTTTSTSSTTTSTDPA